MHNPIPFFSHNPLRFCPLPLSTPPHHRAQKKLRLKLWKKMVIFCAAAMLLIQHRKSSSVVYKWMSLLSFFFAFFVMEMMDFLCVQERGNGCKRRGNLKVNRKQKGLKEVLLNFLAIFASNLSKNCWKSTNLRERMS